MSDLIEQMAIGRIKPLFFVRLEPRAKKGIVQKVIMETDKWRLVGFHTPKYKEGGETAEIAYCQHLDEEGIKYEWNPDYDYPGEARADFTGYRNGSPVTIGVTSGHYLTMKEYEDNPVIFYRSLERANPVDYVVAISVMTNELGGSDCAIWGAMAWSKMKRLLKALPVRHGKGGDHVSIPLPSFLRDDLVALENQLDRR